MRVPVYERQTSIAPLPAPNASTLAPAGDFGANAAGAVQALAEGFKKLQDDADDARTLELFGKFKADSNDYHDNPDTGLYNTRLGYMAKGVYSDADSWLRKKGEEYVRGLSSERAKHNFRKMARDFITQQGLANSRFEAQQIRKYQTEQADAAVNNYLADIEAHWDDDEYISRARENIAQALELKHRGQGREVLFNAGLEVDDKIALARIRQAYSVNPLRAVSLLNDKNIKLKPESRAKVIEYLRGKTEIYELNAIAQDAAKSFSPENAKEAYDSLVAKYGADKGSKAFNALSHLWIIANYQDTATRQRISRQQDDTRNAFLTRFFNEDETLNENEIRNAINSKSIDPQSGGVIINALKARQNEAKRLQAEQDRLQRQKYEMQLDILSWSGKWADDNQLEAMSGDLSRDFLNGYRNRRRQEQERERKEQQKEAANQEKLQHQEELDSYAMQIADAYSEGNGRDFIQKLNIPHDDREKLLQAFDNRIKTKKIQGKEKSEDHKNAVKELVNIELGRIMDGRGQTLDFYRREWFATGLIDKSQLDALETEINKQDNAATEARKTNMLYRARDTAKSLFDAYGLDNLQQAYDDINAIPDIDERDQTRKEFDTLVAEQTRVRTEQDRAKRERQEATYTQLRRNYWDNFKPIPDVEKLYDNGDINDDQRQKINGINDRIMRRIGVEERLRQDPAFYSMTPEQQEAAILLRLGTDENDRKNNVAALLTMLQNGTLTDARVDEALAQGQINKYDAEHIKTFDRRFDREQKRIVNDIGSKLIQDIINLNLPDPAKKQRILGNARLAFLLATEPLNPRADDFSKQLEDIRLSIWNNVLEEVANNFTLDKSYFGVKVGRTPLGERVDRATQEVSSFSIPQTQVSIPYYNAWGQWSNLDANGNFLGDTQTVQPETQHDPYYVPRNFFNELSPLEGISSGASYSQPQTTATAPQQPVAQSQGIVDFTKDVLQNVAYHITDGYYAAKKAYRQGRSHFAIDLRAPEGSSVTLPGQGVTWTVSRTGNGKSAGNFITATTTTHNGDNLEITYGHLSSVDVKKGDTLTSGDIVAKSGSTGNTTGPHLHISAKLNGKPVDPRSIDFGSHRSQDVQNPTLEPLVVSSDAQRRESLRDIFRSYLSLDVNNYGVR